MDQMYDKMIVSNLLKDAGIATENVVQASAPETNAGYSWSEEELTKLEESANQVIATSTNVLAIERAERLLTLIQDTRENGDA